MSTSIKPPLSFSSLMRILRYFIIVMGFSLLFLFTIDRWITLQTQNSIIHDQSRIEHYDVGVVLGTSKYLGKVLNLYYTKRIEAAIQLFREGKLHHLLLSGDNAHRSYNEPWTMKRDLLRAGIPEDRISLDYAGFRTLDSVMRAREIFESNHFLIITQGFHCERALFIAQYHDIDAQCLAVSGPTGYSGLYVRLREVLARVKAVIDLYILDSQPKFMGPKEPIIIDETRDVVESTVVDSNHTSQLDKN